MTSYLTHRASRKAVYQATILFFGAGGTAGRRNAVTMAYMAAHSHGDDQEKQPQGHLAGKAGKDQGKVPWCVVDNNGRIASVEHFVFGAVPQGRDQDSKEEQSGASGRESKEDLVGRPAAGVVVVVVVVANNDRITAPIQLQARHDLAQQTRSTPTAETKSGVATAELKAIAKTTGPFSVCDLLVLLVVLESFDDAVVVLIML